MHQQTKNYKENFTNSIINQRIASVRQKNSRLIHAIQKRDQFNHQRKSYFDIPLIKNKKSQKMLPQIPKQQDQTKYKFQSISTMRHYSTPGQQSSLNLKTVKIPLSKLVPMSIDKLRQRIRML